MTDIRKTRPLSDGQRWWLQSNGNWRTGRSGTDYSLPNIKPLTAADHRAIADVLDQPAPAPVGAPVTREALAPKIAENYSGERDWGRLYHSERSSYCEIADALLATYDIRERVP